MLQILQVFSQQNSITLQISKILLSGFLNFNFILLIFLQSFSYMHFPHPPLLPVIHSTKHHFFVFFINIALSPQSAAHCIVILFNVFQPAFMLYFSKSIFYLFCWEIKLILVQIYNYSTFFNHFSFIPVSFTFFLFFHDNFPFLRLSKKLHILNSKTSSSLHSFFILSSFHYKQSTW